MTTLSPFLWSTNLAGDGQAFERLAELHALAVARHQHVAEGHGVASVARQLFDNDHVVFANPVLLTAVLITANMVTPSKTKVRPHEARAGGERRYKGRPGAASTETAGVFPGFYHDAPALRLRPPAQRHAG